MIVDRKHIDDQSSFDICHHIGGKGSDYPSLIASMNNNPREAIWVNLFSIDKISKGDVGVIIGCPLYGLGIKANPRHHVERLFYQEKPIPKKDFEVTQTSKGLGQETSLDIGHSIVGALGARCPHLRATSDTHMLSSLDHVGLTQTLMMVSPNIFALEEKPNIIGMFVHQPSQWMLQWGGFAFDP